MTQAKEPVSLQQLRALVALSDCLSFTVAADQLDVSQPSVSHLIRRLEDGVGLALVARGRSLRLTAEGFALAEATRHAVHAIDVAVRNCQERSKLSAGSVAIAVGHLSAATLMPPILREFQRRHPAVVLTVTDCTVEEVRRRLVAHEVEIAIGAAPRQDDPELRMETLWDGPIDVVSRKDHPFAKRKSIDGRALSEQRCIQISPGVPPWQAVHRALNDSGVQPNFVHSVRLLSTAMGMVQAGMGVALLPRLASLQAPRTLRFTPLRNPLIRWQIHAIRLANHPISPAAQAFLATTREVMKGFDAPGR